MEKRPADFLCIALASFVLTSLTLFSCATAGGKREPPPDSGETAPPPRPLLLTFVGDLMAHNVNFQMPDYPPIYAGIRDFLLEDDLTFANLEIPVADSLPLSTYPRFNVHTPYLAAAVEAGCDVFSLANNHSNDQGETGIRETAAAVSSMKEAGAIAGFSGLKENKDDAVRPVLIEAGGRTILFVAVTQILNAYDEAGKLVHYVPPTEKGRADFERALTEMRKENPCDIFVLSIHTNEPEYQIRAPESKKTWFRKLAAECGVDIIWAHHPHVMQEWEIVPGADTPEGTGREKFIIYSAGNFISGQRWNMNWENPAAPREYTGDAYIFRVAVTDGTLAVAPVLITNYRNPEAARGGDGWYLTIRRFTADFLESIPGESLQAYYKARLALMREFLE